ncbi:MAG: DinB family protein [Acidobacteria bacterium]|nr:MAG: DinB family protein [Acidobacteriota bacterium]
MDATTRASLWEQFGASLEMLANAIRACSDKLWADPTRQPQFWYTAYHTLFYLDLYLSDATDGFMPPAPFTLSELDPAGVLPDRVYSKTELLDYLAHGRGKARARIESLTAESAGEPCRYGWLDLTKVEALLYNMRHVQHHAAQLNLLLRQAVNDAPHWIRRSSDL